MKFKIRCYPSAKHAVDATLIGKTFSLDGIETIQCGDILSISGTLEPQGLLIVEEKTYSIDVEHQDILLVIAVGLYESLDEYRATR